MPAARAPKVSPQTAASIRDWWGPRNCSEWKDEFLAAIVVCFAQIPESVAFAALAHCRPAVGLHAAWTVGLVCAVFGGRPGMVSGSAGALASVSAGFVSANGAGVEELFLSVIGAGVIICVAAACRIGRFLPLVPATVMIGFCNGLAIVIGQAQLAWFKGTDGQWLEGNTLVYTVIQCIVALSIMAVLPRITRQLPASLIAIVVGCLLERFVFTMWLDTPTLTIGDKSRFETSESVPRFFFWNDAYDLANVRNGRAIASQSLTLALVAVLESLLTLEVVNDLTRTQGQPNRQVWALGGANVLAGLLGTMGGNALIELSVMNVQAGGVRRMSSTLAALGVLAVVLFASPLLNYIPAGSLAGIMVLVVADTAKWSSLPAIVASLLPPSALAEQQGSSWTARAKSWLRGLRVQRYDAFVIVLVTVTTAVTNLAVAVFCGIFFTSVRFAWQSQKPLEVKVEDKLESRTYYLEGNLFFASRGKLSVSFHPETDPQRVRIDFAGATVYDFSVLYAFHPILERYAERGVEVSLANLPDATHLHNLLQFGNVKDVGQFHQTLRMDSRAGTSSGLEHEQEDVANMAANPA